MSLTDTCATAAATDESQETGEAVFVWGNSRTKRRMKQVASGKTEAASNKQQKSMCRSMLIPSFYVSAYVVYNIDSITRLHQSAGRQSVRQSVHEDKRVTECTNV